jgi:hypothetical protein
LARTSSAVSFGGGVPGLGVLLELKRLKYARAELTTAEGSSSPAAAESSDVKLLVCTVVGVKGASGEASVVTGIVTGFTPAAFAGLASLDRGASAAAACEGIGGVVGSMSDTAGAPPPSTASQAFPAAARSAAAAASFSASDALASAAAVSAASSAASPKAAGGPVAAGADEPALSLCGDGDCGAGGSMLLPTNAAVAAAISAADGAFS